jgi:hypothetical protein
MPREFTVEMCEAIFAAPKLMASGIEWRAKDSRTFIFQAKVLCDSENIVLDLTGHWCRNDFVPEIRWGFNLTLGNHCIRSYDMSKRHRNVKSGSVRGPHKHKFHGTKIPRFAYKPSPPIDDRDCNKSLMDFLVEANITLPTEYQTVMFS